MQLIGAIHEDLGRAGGTALRNQRRGIDELSRRWDALPG
jgi:hypothetical protein